MNIHDCCRSGDLSAVRRCLDAHVDVNEKDPVGWSPLHRATKHGRLAVVKELIKHGGNLYDRKPDGWTVLHLASCNNHIDIVEYLVEHHSDVVRALCSVPTVSITEWCDGWTPLHVASEYGRVKIVRALICYSDLSIRNALGQTASDVAKTDKIRKVFLDYETSLDIKEPEFD
jgi:ankyrin repeat protein